jgi:hypothetical protein
LLALEAKQALPVDDLLKELIVRSRWRILLLGRHSFMEMRKKLVQTDTTRMLNTSTTILGWPERCIITYENAIQTSESSFQSKWNRKKYVGYNWKKV